ncbi:MAG: protein kinase, partial [Planctomycetes bacterium]|nr:protein kinase [Planctomycetota bacterium]
MPHHGQPENPLKGARSDDPAGIRHAGSSAMNPDSAAEPQSGGSSGSEDDTRAASSGFKPRHIDDSRPRIEGYVLKDELHRGGQGIVYRALQIGTKREVALKVLLEGPFASDDTRRRFEREVELAASLKHPNIVTILDSGVDHGRYYYAMEYIQGERLGHYWKLHKPPMAQTLRLFERICQAVNFAHQRGVIHRDLKPSNILVDQDGQPQIFDFGLAKPIHTADGNQSTVHLLSTTGQVLGTIAYMSPEQAASPQDVDVRSDVYSLGVILFETLLGQSPYPVSGTLAEVLTHIAETEPAAPKSLRHCSRFGREIDDELSTILLKTLEKEPARRYQTAGDLAGDLNRYLNGEPIEAKRASGLYMLRKTLRRYRVHALVASVMMLMLVSSLIGFAYMYRRESGLREKADQAQRTAVRNEETAIESQSRERDAREKAEAVTTRLRESLIRQRIQRGDLAREQGDLALAREAYWDAYQAAPTREALWNLRRYYAETGEIASHQLYVNADGPTVVSPNGGLAATCNRADTVSVHDVNSGRPLGWYAAPGPISCLSIDNDGVLVAAGKGWVRLFGPESLRPSAAIELPIDFTPDSVHFDGKTGRVFVVNARHVWTYHIASATERDDLALRGTRTGAPAYEPLLRRLAIPTTAGVEFISVDARGRLGNELIWMTIDQPPRSVRFSGDDLLAVLSNVVDMVQLSRDQHGQTIRFLEPQGTWDMLDLQQGVGTLVLATRDGRVALYSSGSLQRTWRVTHGTLHDVRFADDGTLLTRDGRGTLTRWSISEDSQRRRTLLTDVASDWVVSADGSTAVLIDERGQATLYRNSDGHLTRLATLGGAQGTLSTFSGGVDVSVSLSADGQQILLRQGQRLIMSDAIDREALWTATWSDDDTPLLKEALMAADGTRIAIRAESTRGDRQLVAFYVATTPRRSRRGAARRGRLVPAHSPVTIAGSPIRLMAFLPGSNALIMARANGDLATLEPGEVKLQTWVTLDSPAALLEIDPNSRYLAVADDSGVVRILTLAEAEPVARFNIADDIAALDFSPSGEVLLVRSVDGTLRLFDLNTREQIVRWKLTGGGASPLAAWTTGQSMMLAHDGKVFEHHFDRIDDLITANRRYPFQRAIVRSIAGGDWDAAWQTSNRLQRSDPPAASLAQQELLELMLSRRSLP